VLVLDTHDTSTGVLEVVDVIVVLVHVLFLEVGEIVGIFLSDFSHGEACGSLEVDELTKVVFSLDEAEWDTLGSAESWEESHHLDWLDIIAHNNEFGLAFFDEGGNVVHTVFDVAWLWSDMVGFVTSLSGFSFDLESLLLLCSSLWSIFGEDLHKEGSLGSVKALREDVEWCWDLKSHHKDSLLSLDSNVLWPLDESGEILGWLDIGTDSEVSLILLEKRSR